MKNKRIFIIICLVICMLFLISSVNAGIFEFAEDTGEDDDVGFFNEVIKNNDNSDEKSKIKKFEIIISSSDPVSLLIEELEEDYEDYEEDYDDYEKEYEDYNNLIQWLNDFEDDYFVFNTNNDGKFLIINEDEIYKIPNSEKYSSCIVKCKVIKTYKGIDDSYYVVKDIEVKKKIEEEPEETSESTSSSSYSEPSQSYSSESNYDAPSIHYIGNANTGKFHASTCRDVDKINPSNIVNFYSRDEAINNGYSPCGHCRP